MAEAAAVESSVVSEVHYEAPTPPVVLVRSVFYGLVAGAGLGLVVGLIAYFNWAAVPLGAGLGGVVGGVTGLVLGVVLLIVKPPVTRMLRLVVSLIAMTCVFLILSLVFGGWLIHPVGLIFLVPAGAAAWLLLPVVLRPVARDEMPGLPRQST